MMFGGERAGIPGGRCEAALEIAVVDDREIVSYRFCGTGRRVELFETLGSFRVAVGADGVVRACPYV
jgi:hypothetical protein